MKTTLSFIFILVMFFSCTNKIVVSNVEKTREIQIKGKVEIVDNHYKFISKKGTKYYVPMDKFVISKKVKPSLF